MNLARWNYYVQGFFLKFERVLYILIGLGILIATGFIIFYGFKTILAIPTYVNFTEGIIKVLDKFLIAMMFLEVFYTLQVIFGEEYKLKCLEPFLLVGIIALVRRLLIVGFEIAHTPSFDPERFKYYLFEILVIGILILMLIGGIAILRKLRVGR
ncbi:MAG: Uncharacterized protein XD42_0920 [Thermodesulfobacterium sp. 37_54]|uniref:phosphate-starvation-inducible PsiE family protein n=1 Tax=Thermodesulfobacterium commune TaxID=1741 RepID=UPI0007495788|nr:MAG: Uncharacterized protein XD42_0920 [Thermodesulfobacterium sp. 37_54]HBT04330.1 hypothetical protein [Thermodesulfobacterium commune]